MDAMKISRTGLDVEWQRLQVIAQNLANVNTSRGADGAPFQAMRLVSMPKVKFGDVMDKAGKPQGVQVQNVVAMSGGVRRVYDPADPQAGPDGYVSYPEIDHAGEMTLLIKTSRAYEANLTAMNIAHQMYARALELGQGA